MADRILIVEDDADLRESVIRCLSLAGFAVTGAGCAQEFFQCLAGGVFAVAVLDIGLPDQSGLALADYLRRHTELGIVVITAHGDIEERVSGYEAGADIYLVKPVAMPELIAAITRLIQRCKPAVAPAAQTWALSPGQWQLTSPVGVAIPLTGKELVFLRLLADAGGELVPRERILHHLHYIGGESSERALHELVRRLRKKIRELTHAEDPIHTFHSQGYSFSGPLGIRNP